MRIFNSLDNLLIAAKKDTSQALAQALENPEIKRGLSQAIEETVYSHYDSFSDEKKKSPYIYTPRRDNGGLSDHDNMHAAIYDEVDDIITGVLRTYAGRNTNYPGNDPDSNYFDAIDKIIVTGEDYSWKRSQFAKSKIPRDFYAYALATGLITKTQLKELILEYLENKGW